MARPHLRALLVLVLSLAPGGLWADAPCPTRELTPLELARGLGLEGDESPSESPGAGMLVLDMRTSAQFLAGTLPGAINISQLEAIRADESHQDADNQPVVIVTETGLIAGDLAAWIAQLCGKGVAVWILQGGLQGWRAQGLALEDPTERLTIPGSVPFVIPRGLCEMNDPAQQYQ